MYVTSTADIRRSECIQHNKPACGTLTLSTTGLSALMICHVLCSELAASYFHTV